MAILKMAKPNQAASIILLTMALCLGGELLSSVSAWAGVPFNPPKGGAPKGRGGASRGDMTCSANPAQFIQRFMPLTPANSNYGLTVAQRPTLFAYVPPTSAQKVFFSLKEENGRVHYQAMLPIGNNGGILRIELPESVPPLMLGKRYQWGVAVACDGRLRPDSPFVSSWIQRVEPASKLVEQASQKPSIEQATMYGTNGIWYDTLATLANLRRQQPDNPTLRSTWSDLLSSVGLKEIAAEPLND
ncbi:MAG: DUF928 domain-containing protein [Kovacikia sp.]